jgi:hypothetical protein
MGVRVWEWDGGKNGQKAWWIFINHQGKRKAKGVGPGPEGRKAIMLLAEKLSAKRALDDFDIHEEPRMTLAQYAEGWMSEDVERNLRVTTAAKLREVMRKHWIPALGHVALRDLMRQGIRASVQRFQQQGLQNSASAGFSMCCNPAWRRPPRMGNWMVIRRRIRQGQSPVFVKEQQGHSSIRITVDLYGHAIRSSDKSAVDQLDDPDASLRKSDASNDIRGLKLIKGGLA